MAAGTAIAPMRSGPSGRIGITTATLQPGFDIATQRGGISFLPLSLIYGEADDNLNGNARSHGK